MGTNLIPGIIVYPIIRNTVTVGLRMKEFDQLKHHPMVETLVDILCARTQNPDKNFFTIQVCYHLTKCASMMRTRIDAQGFGNLLVNFYGINTAPSGAGLK